MTSDDSRDEDEEEEDEAPPSADSSPPLEVNFWPRTSTGIKIMDSRAISARAALLFDPSIDGAQLLSDPTNRSNLGWTPPGTFKMVPSEFLRRAQRLPPIEPIATASAFSQWVYSLYGNAYGDDEDRERGKEIEGEIFNRRRYAASSVSNAYLRSVNSDWRLVHNGLHMDQRHGRNDKSHTKHFDIPHLMVRGWPLRASPDLIYLNRRTSAIVIVEIKHSRLFIPANLWPNVWAQLWCYSKIGLALSASKVTVIGEVWGQWWTRGRRGKGWYDPGKQIVCLRASVRRDPRAPAFDRFFRNLFDIYRGA